MSTVRRLAAVAVATGIVVGSASVATSAPSERDWRRPSRSSFDDSRVVEVSRPRPYPQYRGSAGVFYHEGVGPVLTANNLASSQVSCDNCHGKALSFQVVIGNGGPQDVTVANTARSVVAECASCSSAAVAYQFIVTTPGRAYLSFPARMRLMGISWNINMLARSSADPMEVKAQAEGYAAEISAMLQSDLRVRPRVRKYLHLEAAPTAVAQPTDRMSRQAAPEPERLSIVEQDDTN